MPTPKQPERRSQFSKSYSNAPRHSILLVKIKELEEAAIEARVMGNKATYDLFQAELIVHVLDLYAAIGTNPGTRKPNRRK